MNKGRVYTQARYKRFTPENVFPWGPPVWLSVHPRATAVVDGLLWSIDDWFDLPARYDVQYAGPHLYWRFVYAIPFTSRNFIVRVRTSLQDGGGNTIQFSGRISGNADTWETQWRPAPGVDFWNPAFDWLPDNDLLHTGGGLAEFRVIAWRVPIRSTVIAAGLPAYTTLPRRILP